MALSIVRRVAPLPRGEALRAAGGVAVLAIKVRPDVSCLLALGLSAWTFADTIFPAAAPGRMTTAYCAAGIVAAASLIASLALHEIAHAVAGRRAGLVPRRIALSPFGGATTFDRAPETPAAACAVAMAGPLANLGAALVAGLVHVALVEADADPLVAAVAAVVSAINVGLVTINLIPVLPLDGGHVLRVVLAGATGRADIAASLTIGAGRVLRWVLLGVAVVASASGDVAIALWAALIGFAVDDHVEDAAPRTRGLSRLPELRAAKRPAA